jgi:hypothetical protein
MEFGDKVLHKKNNYYNYDLITVLSASVNGVNCEFYDYLKSTYRVIYFELDEVELVKKVDGGFC